MTLSLILWVSRKKKDLCGWEGWGEIFFPHLRNNRIKFTEVNLGRGTFLVQHEEHCLERKQGIFPLLTSLFLWNLTIGFHLGFCHNEMNAGKQKTLPALITWPLQAMLFQAGVLVLLLQFSSLQTRPLLRAMSWGSLVLDDSAPYFKVLQRMDCS